MVGDVAREAGRGSSCPRSARPAARAPARSGGSRTGSGRSRSFAKTTAGALSRTAWKRPRCSSIAARVATKSASSAHTDGSSDSASWSAGARLAREELEHSAHLVSAHHRRAGHGAAQPARLGCRPRWKFDSVRTSATQTGSPRAHARPGRPSSRAKRSAAAGASNASPVDVVGVPHVGQPAATSSRSSTVQNAATFQPNRAATVLSTPCSPSFSEAASASLFCTA